MLFCVSNLQFQLGVAAAAVVYYINVSVAAFAYTVVMYSVNVGVGVIVDYADTYVVTAVVFVAVVMDIGKLQF